MIEQLPEAVCETFSQSLAFSDFQKLTTQQLDYVCKWLTSRVYMFCSNITDCVNIDLRKKFDLVGTADGNALMVYEGWQRFLKVTDITHCKRSCSCCWAHSVVAYISHARMEFAVPHCLLAQDVEIPVKKPHHSLCLDLYKQLILGVLYIS